MDINLPSDELCAYTGPDLSGSWVSLDQTCSSSSKGLKCRLTGAFSVGNTGGHASSSTYVLFYLSDDPTFDGGKDLFLKKVSTGRIQPGANKAIKLSLNLPAGSTAAGKYVIAVIDAEQKVVEEVEGNNEIPLGPIE
jgi:hypothetical protein